MSKGIAVECQCCGTTSDITEMVAHDIFGFSLAQVQHILHDYREQVPVHDAIARRMSACRDTRLVMYELLKRLVTDGQSPADHLKLSVDIAKFLQQVRPDDPTL